MSCYIVPNNHISAILRYACGENLHVSELGLEVYRPGKEQEAGELLYEANVRSVNARYKEDNPETGFLYNPNASDLRPIEVIKLCDALAYQCDEWEQFDTSHAAKLIIAIQSRAIHKLPGYDAAPWSIE